MSGNPNCYHAISGCNCAEQNEPPCPVHGEGCLHCGDACELEHQLWKKELLSLKSLNEELVKRNERLREALDRILYRASATSAEGMPLNTWDSMRAIASEALTQDSAKRGG